MKPSSNQGTPKKSAGKRSASKSFNTQTSAYYSSDRNNNSYSPLLRETLARKIRLLKGEEWWQLYENHVLECIPVHEDISLFEVATAVQSLEILYYENGVPYGVIDSDHNDKSGARDKVFNFEKDLLDGIVFAIEKNADISDKPDVAEVISRDAAEELCRAGLINEKEIDKARFRIQEVIQDILSGKALEATASPSVPELRWSDDRQKGERPHEFILRAWGDGEQLPDWLDRPLLRKTDRALYTALVRQEGHTDPDKRPPAGFHVPTKSEKIDRQLAEFERTGGEGLSYQDRERLRSTRSTREHRARK